jgi:hypothetical protein
VAIDTLTRFLKLRPQSRWLSRVHRRLGLAYELAGNPEQAARFRQLALEDPHTVLASRLAGRFPQPRRPAIPQHLSHTPPLLAEHHL